MYILNQHNHKTRRKKVERALFRFGFYVEMSKEPFYELAEFGENGVVSLATSDRVLNSYNVAIGNFLDSDRGSQLFPPTVRNPVWIVGQFENEFLSFFEVTDFSLEAFPPTPTIQDPEFAVHLFLKNNLKKQRVHSPFVLVSEIPLLERGLSRVLIC
jgi:hypothetical protein